MNQTGYLIDDRFRRHDTGIHHPESPSRLDNIQRALDAAGAAGRWYRVPAHPASAEQLALIHSPEHIERVRRSSQRAPVFLDPDTPVCRESYDAALLAAGSVLACVDALQAGKVRRAFAFVRPPGHHAEPGRAMGFCLFNNISVGAAWLRSHHGLERVAVIDVDLHHGNGTQACFYDDPHVLYVSTHQYPYYPGTGGIGEVGTGDGRGFTVNLPLPAGTGDGVFVPVYARIVPAILDQFRPQCILVSTGFDAAGGDPLGGLAVSPAGYAAAAASLCAAADRCCEGRICFVLEGGYSPSLLQACTAAVMAALESGGPVEMEHPEDPLFGVLSNLAAGELGEFWKW